MVEGRVTITIKRTTRNKLSEIGNFDDTYDTVINRLIDAYLQSSEE